VGETRRFPRTPEQEFLEAAEAARRSLPRPRATRPTRPTRPGTRALTDEDRAAVDAVLRERKAQRDSGQIKDSEAGSQEPGFFGLGGLRRGG